MDRLFDKLYCKTRKLLNKNEFYFKKLYGRGLSLDLS